MHGFDDCVRRRHERDEEVDATTCVRHLFTPGHHPQTACFLDGGRQHAAANAAAHSRQLHGPPAADELSERGLHHDQHLAPARSTMYASSADGPGRGKLEPELREHREECDGQR